MKYSLFLDDERFPPESKINDWIIARTMYEAVEIIQNNNLPWRMSLDHDLGKNQKSGQEFIKWLIKQDLNKIIDINHIKDFYIHSQNPIGKENMNSLFYSYKNHKNLENQPQI